MTFYVYAGKRCIGWVIACDSAEALKLAYEKFPPLDLELYQVEQRRR
jgi:hypothetical protein